MFLQVTNAGLNADGVGWGGVGWDGMGWGEVGWDGTGFDWMAWHGMGRWVDDPSIMPTCASACACMPMRACVRAWGFCGLMVGLLIGRVVGGACWRACSHVREGKQVGPCMR